MVSFLLIRNSESDLTNKVASESEIEAIINPNFSPRGADTDDDDLLLLRPGS